MHSMPMLYHQYTSNKKDAQRIADREEQKLRPNADLSKFEVHVTFDNKRQAATTVYFNQSDGVQFEKYVEMYYKRLHCLKIPAVTLSTPFFSYHAEHCLTSFPLMRASS